MLYFSLHLRQIPLTNLLSLSSSAEKIHYQFLFNVKAFQFKVLPSKTCKVCLLIGTEKFFTSRTCESNLWLVKSQLKFKDSIFY